MVGENSAAAGSASKQEKKLTQKRNTAQIKEFNQRKMAREVRKLTSERNQAQSQEVNYLATISTLERQFAQANNMLADAQRRLKENETPTPQPYLPPVVKVTKDNRWIADIWLCSRENAPLTGRAEGEWKRSQTQAALNTLSKQIKRYGFKYGIICQLMLCAILISCDEFAKALDTLDPVIRYCKSRNPPLLPRQVGIAHYLRGLILMAQRDWRNAVDSLSLSSDAIEYAEKIRPLVPIAAEYASLGRGIVEPVAAIEHPLAALPAQPALPKTPEPNLEYTVPVSERNKLPYRENDLPNTSSTTTRPATPPPPPPPPQLEQHYSPPRRITRNRSPSPAPPTPFQIPHQSFGAPSIAFSPEPRTERPGSGSSQYTHDWAPGTFQDYRQTATGTRTLADELRFAEFVEGEEVFESVE